MYRIYHDSDVRYSLSALTASWFRLKLSKISPKVSSWCNNISRTLDNLVSMSLTCLLFLSSSPIIFPAEGRKECKVTAFKQSYISQVQYKTDYILWHLQFCIFLPMKIWKKSLKVGYLIAKLQKFLVEPWRPNLFTSNARFISIFTVLGIYNFTMNVHFCDDVCNAR